MNSGKRIQEAYGVILWGKGECWGGSWQWHREQRTERQRSHVTSRERTFQAGRGRGIRKEASGRSKQERVTREGREGTGPDLGGTRGSPGLWGPHWQDGTLTGDRGGFGLRPEGV